MPFSPGSPPGPPGPPGPPTIIQDEGVPLAGAPHSTINFVGAGVAATDGGGGVAVVTVPASSGITIVGPIAATGLQNVDFPALPAGIKRIKLMLDDISVDSAANLRAEIGDAGGFPGAGYTSVACLHTGPGSNTFATTGSGFLLTGLSAAVVLYNGTVTLDLSATADTWLQSGVIGAPGSPSINQSSGKKTLTGVLTQVRLTQEGGGSLFDSGSVSLSYES